MFNTNNKIGLGVTHLVRTLQNYGSLLTQPYTNLILTKKGLLLQNWIIVDYSPT